MKRKSIFAAIMVMTLIASSVPALGGCAGNDSAADAGIPDVTAQPIVKEGQETTTETETAIETGTSAESDTGSGRQDGERFEDVIIMEGMEETVKYEHVVNKEGRFEIDYDYESFTRSSESGREVFVSIYDDASNPENYLEIEYRAESAETVADSVGEKLSAEYDIDMEVRTLENAGDCTYIDASVIKGTNNMADKLQAVYVIPCGDGCILATEHYAIEASEGFGRRFGYMMNTLRLD